MCVYREDLGGGRSSRDFQRWTTEAISDDEACFDSTPFLQHGVGVSSHVEIQRLCSVNHQNVIVIDALRSYSTVHYCTVPFPTPAGPVILLRRATTKWQFRCPWTGLLIRGYPNSPDRHDYWSLWTFWGLDQLMILTPFLYHLAVAHLVW
jgi:hypothetical protein